MKTKPQIRFNYKSQKVNIILKEQKFQRNFVFNKYTISQFIGSLTHSNQSFRPYQKFIKIIFF